MVYRSDSVEVILTFDGRGLTWRRGRDVRVPGGLASPAGHKPSSRRRFRCASRGGVYEPPHLRGSPGPAPGPARPPARGIPPRPPFLLGGVHRPRGPDPRAEGDGTHRVPAAPDPCAAPSVRLRRALRALARGLLPRRRLLRDPRPPSAEPPRQGHPFHRHCRSGLPRAPPRRAGGPDAGRGRGAPGGALKQLLRPRAGRAPHRRGAGPARGDPGPDPGGRAGDPARHPPPRARRSAAGGGRVLHHQRVARNPARGEDRRPPHRGGTAGAGDPRPDGALGDSCPAGGGRALLGPLIPWAEGRAQEEVSAHFPWPSKTRSTKGKPIRSLSPRARSSQMFSTEGYSRKSFQWRGSLGGGTAPLLGLLSAKPPQHPPPLPPPLPPPPPPSVPSAR